MCSLGPRGPHLVQQSKEIAMATSEENLISSSFYWIGIGEHHHENPGIFRQTMAFSSHHQYLKSRKIKRRLKHTIQRTDASFLIYNKDEREELKKPRLSEEFGRNARQREPSICESEDSFIVFDYSENSSSEESECEDDVFLKDLKTCKSAEVDEPDYATNHMTRHMWTSGHSLKTACKNSPQKDDIPARMFKDKFCKPRYKEPSICESEDSFIMFDRTGDTASNGDSETYDEDDDDDEEEDSDDDQSDKAPVSDIENLIKRIPIKFETCQRPKAKKVSFASEKELCEVHHLMHWSFAHQAARKGGWETAARDRTRFNDRIERVGTEINIIFNQDLRNRIFTQRFEGLYNLQ